MPLAADLAQLGDIALNVGYDFHLIVPNPAYLRECGVLITPVALQSLPSALHTAEAQARNAGFPGFGGRAP